MTTETPYWVRLTAGFVALALIVGGVLVVAEKSKGAFAGGYNETAIAARSGLGLFTGSEVQIRGVTVGAVVGARLLPDDKVALNLHFNNGVQVPVTASASIDPQSVFGPEDVNIYPGKDQGTGPYLRPDSTIRNVVTSNDLLQVLQEIYPVLKAIDPTDLSTVVQNVSDALDGLGPDIRQTIDSLHTVAANARLEIPNLESLLGELAQLTAALAPTGNQIVSISENLDNVLPILNQPDRVSALLDNVSQVASDLSGVLEGHQAGIDATVNGLTAVAAALAPRAPELPVLTQSLNSFFTLLTNIIHGPGEAVPGGFLVGNIQGYLPTDPCQLLVGVCPGTP